jgi:hypothetical protein
MVHHDYRLRQEALETLQPLYEAATDRRKRGAMNRGINAVATSDPSDLFQRFPAVADAVGGDGEDLLKLLTKTERTDTRFGSFGSGFGLEWHHRNMSLGELGKEARKLRPDVFQEFTYIFGSGGVKFGQTPAQMRIQAEPTHVPDGIRGNNWLTSHSAGKSPFRLPTWSEQTTAAEAVADATPIVNNNIAQSNFAESLTPHKVTTDRLTDALGYNPLENQENLTMDQRKDIGKELKKKNFKAFSIEEAQQWISNNQDMLSKMKPKHLAQLGLLSASVFGVGVSAAETGIRGKQAMETGNAADWLQTALSGASLASDFIPVAGELISTPADQANVFIDTYREPGFKAAPNPLEARNQQLKNSLKTNPKSTPQPKSEAGYETIGRLGNQMLGGLKQVGGKILFGF